jgi:hypothetical protein
MVAIVIAGSKDAPVKAWHGAFVLFHVIWNLPVLVREAAVEYTYRPSMLAALVRARASCEGGYILAPDLGVDWALNGRIHTIPMELSLRRDVVLNQRWEDDTLQARCVALYRWPPSKEPVTSLRERVYPEHIEESLRRDFHYAWSDSGLHLFVRKEK